MVIYTNESMANKTLEVKTDRGNRIIIPIENILYVMEGDRQTNYIYLKDSKEPIETAKNLDEINRIIQS